MALWILVGTTKQGSKELCFSTTEYEAARIRAREILSDGKLYASVDTIGARDDGTLSTLEKRVTTTMDAQRQFTETTFTGSLPTARKL